MICLTISLLPLQAQNINDFLAKIEKSKKKLNSISKKRLPINPTKDDYLSLVNNLEVRIDLIKKIQNQYIETENFLLAQISPETSKPKETNLKVQIPKTNYSSLRKVMANAILKDELISKDGNYTVENKSLRELYLKQIYQTDSDNSISVSTPVVSEKQSNLDSLHAVVIKEIGSYEDQLISAKNEMSSAANYLKRTQAQEKSSNSKTVRVTVGNSNHNNKYSSIVANVQGILRLPEIKDYPYRPDFALDNKLIEDRKGFIPLPLSQGKRALRYEEKVNGRKHDGVVLSSSKSLVQNISQGIVLKVGTLDNKKYIVVKHDGEFMSVYANLARSHVVENQKISFNQSLGEAYKSKDNTYALHFQIWKGSQSLNPSRWLKNN